MILASTTEPVRFTPAWREQDADAPVYLLRAGSVLERSQLEAELAGPLRAGRVFGFELREAVIGGVQALMKDDPDQDRVLALLGDEQEEGATLSDADARLLTEVRGVLAQHWPPYGDLIAQLERRREMAPLAAFRRFCTGWEGGAPGKHEYGRDGLVTDAALRRLDPLELMAAGNHAYELLYAGGQEGNSARPAPSESGPATSSSDAPSATDG